MRPQSAGGLDVALDIIAADHVEDHIHAFAVGFVLHHRDEILACDS